MAHRLAPHERSARERLRTHEARLRVSPPTKRDCALPATRRVCEHPRLTMSNSRTNAGRWRRILFWQGIAIVGLFVVGEVATRVVLRVRGHPHDSIDAAEEFRAARSRAVDFVPKLANDAHPNRVDDAKQAPVLHPYLGFVVAAKLDELRIEMTRIGPPENDADYELLLVGGSVADIFGRLGWPRLNELLSADPRMRGRKIHLYAFACGGFKQPQTVNLVEHMLDLGFTPEGVLDIDGFNEVALSNANAHIGISPTYPSAGHWASLTAGAVTDREAVTLAAAGVAEQESIRSLAEFAITWHLDRSALASVLVRRRLHSHESAARTAFDAYSQRMIARSDDAVRRGPPFASAGLPAVEIGVRTWENGSRTLRALCEARGIDYVHVLQPTLHDEGSKVLTPKEIAAGGSPPDWVEGVKLGYPLLRAAGERLRAGGENFIDATGVFREVSDKVYFDDCHFNEHGNVILAEFIASHFFERPQPVK